MRLLRFRLPSGARCEASQRSQRRCSQPVPQLKVKRQRRFQAVISAPDPVRENAIPIFGDADRQLMALLGHGAMFNLSPLFAPKRRFANGSCFMGSRPKTTIGIIEGLLRPWMASARPHLANGQFPCSEFAKSIPEVENPYMQDRKPKKCRPSQIGRSAAQLRWPRYDLSLGDSAISIPPIDALSVGGLQLLFRRQHQ